MVALCQQGNRGRKDEFVKTTTTKFNEYHKNKNRNETFYNHFDYSIIDSLQL